MTQTHQKLVDKVSREQLKAHDTELECLKQALEEKDAEIARLQAETGNKDLLAAAPEALLRFYSLFETVKIKDLAEFERGQQFGPLNTFLSELEELTLEQGGITPGTYNPEDVGTDSDADPTSFLNLRSGQDAIAVVRGINKRVTDLAGYYFAKMVEYQGETPDHIVMQRSSAFMDHATTVDAKDTFRTLPEESQRELFDQQVDDLVIAKDQAHYRDMQAQRAISLLKPYLRRMGVKVDHKANLVGMLRAMSERDIVGQSQRLKSAMFSEIQKYAHMIPAEHLIVDRSLSESRFTKEYKDTITEESDLLFLSNAFLALIQDHKSIAGGLKNKTIDAKVKAAVKPLNPSKVKTASSAKRGLAKISRFAQTISEKEQALADHQKTLSKKYQGALGNIASERIASSKDPKTSRIEYDRLSKSERYALHAKDFCDVVVIAADHAHGEQSIDSLEEEASSLVRSIGSSQYKFEMHQRYILRLREAVDGESKPDKSASSAFSLGEGLVTPSISLEEGLLSANQKGLGKEIKEHLSKFKGGKKGITTLEEAKSRLESIGDTVGDKLLKTSWKGAKLPTSKELFLTTEFLSRQEALEEDETNLFRRKKQAVINSVTNVTRMGIDSFDNYDSLKGYVEDQEEVIDNIVSLQTQATHKKEEFMDITTRFSDRTSYEGLILVISDLETEVKDYRAVLDSVSDQKQEYVDEASRLLRKAPADYDAARSVIDGVIDGICEADKLKVIAKGYVSALKATKKSISTLAKASTHINALHRKAKKQSNDLLSQKAEAISSVDSIVQYSS